MSLRIGIIGVGVMGSDHARTIASQVRGAEIEVIYDADAARAKTVADEVGAGRTIGDSLALIDDPGVDAVLVASPDHTHKELVLACIAAGKSVLCEKPLAPSSRECFEVVAAEAAQGRRLVQVGYNRRFDPPYLEVRARLRSGQLGHPLLLHNLHRNVSVLPWFDAGMAITNAAVHDFDISRWLLETEFTGIQVHRPRAAGNSPGAPLFFVLETADGQVVSIEVFNDARYGYDVRAELVCEQGTVAVRLPALTEVSAVLRHSTDYPADWRPRFADSYRLQSQAWVDAVAKEEATGASAWDGYAATRIAEAGLRSLAEGRHVPIKIEERLSLYDQ